MLKHQLENGYTIALYIYIYIFVLVSVVSIAVERRYISGRQTEHGGFGGGDDV